MEPGPIGEFQITNTGDEPVSAFASHPWRLTRPSRWTARSTEPLPRAMLALGRLDGISSLLSDPARFTHACPTLVNPANSFSDEHTGLSHPASFVAMATPVQHSQRIQRQTQGAVVCVQRISCYTKRKS